MKNKKGISLIILIFAIIILLLVGYIVYDKLIAINNEPISNSDTNTNVTDKNEKVEDKEPVNEEKEPEVVLNEKKNMITSDADKIAINTELKENDYIFDLINLTNGLDGDGRFTDNEKVMITHLVATNLDSENLAKNSTGDDYKGREINKEYLKNYSATIFAEEINYNNVEGYSMTDDKIISMLLGAGGGGSVIYKAKNLYLNEKTGEYTLEIDRGSISYEQSHLIEEYSKPEKLELSNVDYKLIVKYKKVDGKKLLISIDKEQIAKNEEPEVVLNEKKNMITSDADKIAINTKLKENQQLVQLMLKNKLNNGEFSDDEKVGITNVIAMAIDKDNFQKNSQGENFENSVDKQYLKNYSLNIFEQPINYDNVTMYTITNDKITTYNPGGMGIAFYKVKSLYLNEKTKIYTLEVDVVSTNIMDHIEEYTKPETIQYDSNCVTSTFTLKYKEVEGKKLLISVDK